MGGSANKLGGQYIFSHLKLRLAIAIHNFKSQITWIHLN